MINKKYYFRIISLISLFTLFSCGGGGGDDSSSASNSANSGPSMTTGGFVSLCTGTSPSAAGAKDPLAGASTGDPIIDNLVNMINAHRSALSPPLPSLIIAEELYLTALGHSEDMDNQNYFLHNAPDGASVVDRVFDEGIAGADYFIIGENLGKGSAYGDAATLFTDWLNSTSHKANIENIDYTHHGIAYVIDEDGEYIWTHVFIKPNCS